MNKKCRRGILQVDIPTSVMKSVSRTDVGCDVYLKFVTPAILVWTSILALVIILFN